MTDFIMQPGEANRIGDYLRARLEDPCWREFTAGVAFVKRSGVRHICRELAGFAARGHVTLLVGVDARGTSVEGLQDLLDAVGDRGTIWIVHNESASTFHPKVYVFRSDSEAEVLVGSGNLTEGGLYTNCEAAVVVALDLTVEADRAFLELVDSALEGWRADETGVARRLDADLLDQLVQRGYVPTEANGRDAEESGAETREVSPAGGGPMFARLSVPPAPRVRRQAQRSPSGERLEEEPVPAPEGRGTFVMTLQQTDVGRGRGGSERSPEVFIPLAARDHAPEFWDWPDAFTEDARRQDKMDRAGVRVLLDGQIIEVNMMTWPPRHDFRLRSEPLRSAGAVGDILELCKTADPAHAYEARVVRTRTPEHASLLRRCDHPVHSSRKRWGYY